jgi:hypothetical protein
MFSCRISCFDLKRKFYFYILLFLGGLPIHPSRDDHISIANRQAVTYNNYVREFLDFSLQELVGIEDDFGHNTISNQYRNPLKKKLVRA